MLGLQQLGMMPGLQSNPVIEYTGIVPETKQDANNLVQLGEIQGLIGSIERILSNKLANAGDMTQRYSRELVNKLKAIYQYRWQSGNDPTSDPKMLVPGKNRGLYITESPHSILMKARQFVGMYADLSNDRSNWSQMSPDQRQLIQRQYGKVYSPPLLEPTEVSGEIVGGGGKELMQKQYDELKARGHLLIQKLDTIKAAVNQRYEELKQTKPGRELYRTKKKLDKRLKVLGQHKKKILAVTGVGAVATVGAIGILVVVVPALAGGLLALTGGGLLAAFGLGLDKELKTIILYSEDFSFSSESSDDFSSEDSDENEKSSERRPSLTDDQKQQAKIMQK